MWIAYMILLAMVALVQPWRVVASFAGADEHRLFDAFEGVFVEGGV